MFRTLRLSVVPRSLSFSSLHLRNMSRPHKKPRIQQMSTATATANKPRSPSPASAAGHFTDKKFQDLNIDRKLKDNIKHEFMTEPGLAGKDLLVQAKTGTGKTVGFLLPAVEKLLRNPNRARGAAILVLSPTRELAHQIAKEARTLLPESALRILCVTGGTSNPTADLDRFISNHYDLIVATPGRLHDYFTGPRKSEVYAKFTGLQTLVLDEVDRLLDGGFARELEGVVNMLPKTPRQNLFFSATIQPKIHRVAQAYLGVGSTGYEFISTLKEDEMNTHQHVHQSYIITPFQKHLSTLLALLHIDALKHALPKVRTSTSTEFSGPSTSSKIIVFFPTARQVAFANAVLSSSGIKKSLPPIFELHSRKSQSARTKASDAFRKASSAILLSSDVAARGVDFPGVTLVVQVAMPSSAEQYVHRLGRTARAGAQGQGILILDPAEERFVSTQPYISAPTSHEAKELETYTHTYSQHVSYAVDALANNTPEITAQAYVAFLGYYKQYSKATKWSSAELVEEAEKYARKVMGWKDVLPPPVLAKTVGMMGLKGVKGLNIVKSLPPRADRT
ncbi:P-loop containing nucleoside triphosphate hydrolase protein [Rhodocollybia butyracea]|uniref:ATP-dependent RNA helicase n=1 Tax=Rhodocollybia butyracea TaxID=206335 RepID=A0A9P5PWT4_9AGAR|nr:P-loop containing nucleoside triphosphate hydrolase protein [Rhodocollybia butyracea]